MREHADRSASFIGPGAFNADPEASDFLYIGRPPITPQRIRPHILSSKHPAKGPGGSTSPSTIPGAKF
jgi:hypothetical protein